MHASALILAVLCWSPTACAEGSAKGSVSFNDKSVAYEIRGMTVQCSCSSTNNAVTIKATIDGDRHEITLSKSELQWNQEKIALTDFSRVEILLDGKVGEIKVDGKRVLPKKE